MVDATDANMGDTSLRMDAVLERLGVRLHNEPQDSEEVGVHVQKYDPWSKLIADLGTEPVHYSQLDTQALLLSEQAILTIDQANTRSRLVENLAIDDIKGAIKITSQEDRQTSENLADVARRALQQKKQSRRRVAAMLETQVTGKSDRKSIVASTIGKVTDRVSMIRLKGRMKSVVPGNEERVIAQLVKSGNAIGDIERSIDPLKQMITLAGGLEGYQKCSETLAKLGLDAVEVLSRESGSNLSDHGKMTIESLVALGQLDEHVLDDVLQTIYQYDPSFLDTDRSAHLIQTVRDMADDPVKRAQIIEVMKLQIQQGSGSENGAAFYKVDTTALDEQVTQSQEAIVARLLNPELTKALLDRFPEIGEYVQLLSSWNIGGMSDKICEQKGIDEISDNIKLLQRIFQDTEKAKILVDLGTVLSNGSSGDPFEYALLVDVAQFIEGNPNELVQRLFNAQKVDNVIHLLDRLPELFPEDGLELLQKVIDASAGEHLVSLKIPHLLKEVRDYVSDERALVLFSRYVVHLVALGDVGSLETLDQFIVEQQARLETYVMHHDDADSGFSEGFVKDLMKYSISKRTDADIIRLSAQFLVPSSENQADVSRNTTIQTVLQSQWFRSTHRVESQIILLDLLEKQDLSLYLTESGQCTPKYIDENRILIDSEPWRLFSMIGNLDTSAYEDESERAVMSAFVQFINRIDIEDINKPMAQKLWSSLNAKKQVNGSIFTAEEVFFDILDGERYVGSLFESYVSRHEISRVESPALYLLQKLTQDLPGSRQAQEYYYDAIQNLLHGRRENAEALIADDGKVSASILEDLTTSGSLETSIFFTLSERCFYSENDHPMIAFLCSVHKNSPLDTLTDDMLMHLVTNQDRWTAGDGTISATVLPDLLEHQCDTKTFFTISEHLSPSSGKDRTLAKLEALRGTVRDDELVLNCYRTCINEGDPDRFADDQGNLNQEFMDLCLGQPEYHKLLLLAHEAGAITLQPGSKHAVYLEYINQLPDFAENILNHSQSLGLYDDGVDVEMFKEKCEITTEAIRRVSRSPSRELRRIAPEVIDSILASPEPNQVLDEIENIFVRNNTPYVGKVFLTFDILFPDHAFEEVLSKDTKLSPILRSLGAEGKRVIFKDLLSIHIESGNRSLEQYLQIFQKAEGILEKVQAEGEASLTPDEVRNLDIFLNKAELATKYAGQEVAMSKNRQDRVQAIATSIGVRETQSIADRLVEVYAKPLGYRSVEEVLSRISDARRDADRRARARVEDCNGNLSFAEGDLVKGVGSSYIAQILQNGSVAKEFLGGAFQRSDATPFDTDVSKIPTVYADFNTNLGQTAFGIEGTGYGDLGVVFREQTDSLTFWDTTELPFEDTDSFKRRLLFGKQRYEVFDSGNKSINHYGIRTGISMTEAAFLIANDTLSNDTSRFDELCFQIAKNGYYIPITDLQGRLLFTPEQFDSYRSLFKGVETYGGGRYEYVPNTSEKTRERVREVKEQLQTEHHQQVSIITQVQQQIDGVFHNLSLAKKTEFTGIAGVSIIDTGSTSRGTNIPGNADFDFVIEIDDISFEDGKTVPALQSEIDRLYPGEKQVYTRHDGSIQMHAIQAEIDGRPIELDFGIIKRPTGAAESTEKILNMIYQSIEEEHGQDVVSDIHANIAYTKQFLKAHGIYKGTTGSPGGLGGIGVEYWLLQHGGSFDQARRSFLDSALNQQGEIIDYELFIQKYQIWDVGLNLLNDKSENLLTKKLNKESYIKMVEVLKLYS